MKNLFAPLLLVIAAATLSACETVEGAGEDLQLAGAAVSETAEDVQDDMQ